MKIVSVVGARPQFVKLAPLTRAIAARNSSGVGRIEHVVIDTGQHYDERLSAAFFRDLCLPEPDYRLGVGSASHAVQTARMLERLESALLQEKPDWTIVYGDTNSTLAGALAAAKLHLRVAHVEAGLRSFNRKMPEEINRVVADHVSDRLLCPTAVAVENLRREGVTQGVHLVGDVMADAVFFHVETARQNSTVLSRLGLESRQYVLATVHRAGNTDDPSRLSAIVSALHRVAESQMPVMLPLHPRTRKALEMLRLGAHSPRLRLVEPVPYLDMLSLIREARLVVTDSGGVQKEALLLGVPTLTLRDETEWVETVEEGWNTLVGADEQKIVAEVERVTRESLPPSSPSPYGSGCAGECIVAILCEE